MKNREVFTILRQHIDPPLSELGFALQKNSGTDLPWSRRLENRRHEIVWCQVDKWPWDVWKGSRFTVNFQDSKHPGIGLSRGAKWARIGALLHGRFLKEAEQLQNAAKRKFRVPTPEEFKRGLFVVTLAGSKGR